MLRRPQRARRVLASRPFRRLIMTLAALVLVFAVASAFLFVWPDRGMPARVSAIVVLGGAGDRIPFALRLAAGHHAAVMVVSTSTPLRTGSTACIPPVRGVRIICFNPDPQTTRGEAEFAGRMVRRYHWTSLAIVAIAPQDLRARLRFGRCLRAKVYVVTAPLPLIDWPYQIAYEWGATLKALVLQRSC